MRGKVALGAEAYYVVAEREKMNRVLLYRTSAGNALRDSITAAATADDITFITLARSARWRVCLYFCGLWAGLWARWCECLIECSSFFFLRRGENISFIRRKFYRPCSPVNFRLKIFNIDCSW